MNRSGRILAAALVVGLSVTALAAQDAKDKGDKGTPAPKKGDKAPPTKDKMLTSGVVTGTLSKLDEDKKFTLSVEVLDIDQGKVQGHLRYQQDQVNQIRGLKNAIQMQQRLADLQVEMARRSLDIYKKSTVKLDLQAEETVKVRSLKPLTTFDKQGEVVTYTKEALKKLAAEGPNLPGVKVSFPSSYDKLQVRQKVIVFLAKTKTSTKKGPDPAAGDLSRPRPRVVAIVIAQEVPQP